MVVVLSHAKSPHVIRTMRIPESLDKALREVAEQRNTSVNALVEASLTRLVEFDQYAEELDYGMVRKVFLVKGLEYLTQDEIREFARWSATELGSDTLRFYGAFPNAGSVIRTYESIISKYGRLYTFRHEVDGKDHTITLSHRMGKNWSIFFEENMKTIFKSLGIDLETERGANLVEAHFTEKPLGNSHR
jgi:hypothetical protein